MCVFVCVYTVYISYIYVYMVDMSKNTSTTYILMGTTWMNTVNRIVWTCLMSSLPSTLRDELQCLKVSETDWITDRVKWSILKIDSYNKIKYDIILDFFYSSTSSSSSCCLPLLRDKNFFPTVFKVVVAIIVCPYPHNKLYRYRVRHLYIVIIIIFMFSCHIVHDILFNAFIPWFYFRIRRTRIT